MSTVARYFQGRGLNERPDLVKLFGGGGGAVRFREFQKGYETYAEKMDNAMQEKQSRRSKRPEKEAGPAFPGWWEGKGEGRRGKIRVFWFCFVLLWFFTYMFITIHN